jgi:tRNA nucleotidyltransferase (CCA-adding enzyme)
MGKQSNDIDIALDDMYGEEFAKILNEKLYPDGQKKFGVIKSNSEKSKHLETATIRVHGTFIDLVNLRSEKYSETSRVPVIEIGTPEEDAYRRDLTINTMFYNINMGEVEDFTKLGIKDLEEGIVRTPLEPLQTFLDDPLRVLRTIRFATRFHFNIIPEIFTAAKDPRVRVSS